MPNSTDWTTPSKITTDWGSSSKNTSDWTTPAKNTTEYFSGLVTSGSLLLTENGDSFQLQDGTNFLGLMID